MIKLKKKIIGSIYIKCSLKNTIITLINNIDNKVLYKISSKSVKTKNLKKNNPNTIQQMSFKLYKILNKNKIKYLKFYIKGFGIGRYNFIKTFSKKKFRIILIEDKTFIPFNGCRLKKKKRK